VTSAKGSSSSWQTVVVEWEQQQQGQVLLPLL
jgi:hypothetical protein